MCLLYRPQLLDTFLASGSWLSSGMSSSRTTHGHKNLEGIILTCWLLTCFLFMHQHTVPRVVDPGKTALVTALVTATVSFRLASLSRLSGHHEKHLTILTTIKPLEVAKSPRPLSACIPRRLEWTLHFPPRPLLCCRRTYFVYTNARKENVIQRWSFHTSLCVVTVRKTSLMFSLDNATHGNLDRASGS